MKDTYTRRRFVQSGAVIAAACAASSSAFSLAQATAPPEKSSPIHLGLASYTFRNFSRTQLIGFMKQLNVTALNAKNAKDHLPMDPEEEAKALEDYAAAGIKLHAAGAIYFQSNDQNDIRSKFEYCKRASIPVIVAGGPALETLPSIEQFVKEYDIRFAIHNHAPEDKVWSSPLDVLKAVKGLDPRIGCCIDVGHTELAGTDVVQAIHAAGPRLFNMHIKDMTNFHDENSVVPVGEGIMPIREIFEALIATKYKGFVDLEYESEPDDPMPGEQRSFAYMRGVLAGMGYISRG
ncbi:MAG: sugar phosphate isomerase/epimerase [Terracidiphilus sp.]